MKNVIGTNGSKRTQTVEYQIVPGLYIAVSQEYAGAASNPKSLRMQLNADCMTLTPQVARLLADSLRAAADEAER